MAGRNLFSLFRAIFLKSVTIQVLNEKDDGVTAIGMYSANLIGFIPYDTETVLITVGSMNKKIVDVDGVFVSRGHMCLTALCDHNIICAPPSRAVAVPAGIGRFSSARLYQAKRRK